MENRAHALVVGLFALLLTAAVFATVWWFGGGGDEFKTYQLETHRGVTGLNSQAAVRFRGVRVGRVMEIDLDDDDPYKVVVVIRVRSDVPVTHGTVATLGFQGLTGNAFVQLDDNGTDPRPLPTSREKPAVIALQPGLLDQANDTGRRVISKLDEASQNAAKVLRPENIERIDKALANLAKSTEHLEKTLAQAPLLMGDLRRFASPETAEQVKRAATELANASKQIGPMVDNMNRALGRVEAAGTRIDKLGSDMQGSLIGETLPRVNSLVTELQGSSTQFNLLLDDVQRTPQVFIFGREAAKPGPGEKTGGSK